jgi:serine/threonine protein kinase
MKFVENGSLADHLSDGVHGSLHRLNNPTKIVCIIVGLVLAMRYPYSQNVIRLDLRPDNILRDINWNVRICNFGKAFRPFIHNVLHWTIRTKERVGPKSNRVMPRLRSTITLQSRKATFYEGRVSATKVVAVFQ